MKKDCWKDKGKLERQESSAPHSVNMVVEEKLEEDFIL